MKASRPRATDRSAIERVRQTPQETRAFYNGISSFYDLLSERSEAPIRESGLDLLSARPGEEVLEVGCGTGHALAALARATRPSGRVVGVDLSEAMAARAHSRVTRSLTRPRAVVTCASALQLPLHDESVDALFSSFTLELFDTPDIPRVLAEWRRVLKPNARLTAVSLSKKRDELAVRAYEWSHRHFPAFVDCRPICLEESLVEAGFEIEKTITAHMWVPVELVLARSPTKRCKTTRG